jgi:hypothetical protein
LAKRVCDMLKDPDHQFGVKSVRKSNKREQGRKVRERYHQVMDYKNGLAKLPLANTKFKTVGGFDTQTYVAPDGKRKKVTRNGIQDHFHFYAQYDMPRDTVATRRIPCSCPSCHVQITMPWIQNVPLTEQDRFKNPDNCLLGNEFGDFNSWKFMELKLAVGCLEEDEINECTNDALAVIEAAMIPLIKFNMFGAISSDNDKEGAPDGYYLVRFTGIPFVLQEPSPVEGCNGGDMPKGTTVVEGRYWNRATRSPHWFQEGEWDDPKLLFRVQYALD